jgi:glycolate oxidase FAD binding subunit
MQVGHETDVIEAVRAGREAHLPLEIICNGTKRKFGRPIEGNILDVSGMRGIIAYEPEELIVTVRPGTPIAELNSVLAEKRQRLGFEPAEWARLFGGSGATTIGGAVSVDGSGSARMHFGGPRDQLLGIRAVNGFGEAFKAGGRVVKNVTGFDIPKLVCGAFGTLCVLTELTFRVYPRPPCTLHLAVSDVTPSRGLELLRRAWSSPIEPTGLAYLPPAMSLGDKKGSQGGIALFRLEGEQGPLEEKRAYLYQLLAGCAVAETEDVFAAIACGTAFGNSDLDLWRVHLPPANAAKFVEEIAPARWLADWAGGLLWIEASHGSGTVEFRTALAQAGAHAILMRASPETRARGVFPEQTPEGAGVVRAVKRAFDPLALFNRGRMYKDV